MLAQSANLIDPSRKALFETRLSPLLQRSGTSNLKDFVTTLHVDRALQLHRAIAEAMMVNETSFFRDVTPFEVLQHTILPRILEQNRRIRTLRVWSAASSTGQEAYSLAMLLRESFLSSTAGM